MDLNALVEQSLYEFCAEFVDTPYLCYTEHGIHALFFQRLYDAIPEESRYFTWQDRKVCVIQKEYPTASDLGKPKRQNWDLSVIKMPPETISDKNPFDFFRLEFVIEFGLNEAREHLVEDVRRLSHPSSNVENRYCVHLYRFSDGVSGRDWSTRSKRILGLNDIREIVSGTDVTVFLAVADTTGTLKNGFWKITSDSLSGGGLDIEGCIPKFFLVSFFTI